MLMRMRSAASQGMVPLLLALCTISSHSLLLGMAAPPFIMPHLEKSPTAQPVEWRGDTAASCRFLGAPLDAKQGVLRDGECQRLCEERRECTRWQLHTASGAGGTCSLFDGAPKKMSASGTSAGPHEAWTCGVVRRIQWRDDGAWAHACDFQGNDLAAVSNTPGEKCTGLCRGRSGCTHFAWSPFQGGTCWLKRGLVSRLDAVPSADPMLVCGVIPERIPHLPGSPLTWLEDDEIANVVDYAPLLRFDSDAVGNCFPSSAADYYRIRKSGDKGKVCNNDFTTIANGDVPVYYSYDVCGDAITIMYWFFYGHQFDCVPGPLSGEKLGEHPSDWERVVVKIQNGQLQEVLYYQHGGQYTRHSGNFEVHEMTHPVVYVGKIAHGSYHDQHSGAGEQAAGVGGAAAGGFIGGLLGPIGTAIGGFVGASGGGAAAQCPYFGDARKPGDKDMKMGTWQNLQKLSSSDGAPEWMRDTRTSEQGGLFEKPPPLSRGDDLCNLKACEANGCEKSDDRDGPF